jgi:ribonuclease D
MGAEPVKFISARVGNFFDAFLNVSVTLKHEYINTAAELDDLCRDLTSKKIIGFDTEFVSEDCYRPQLCLVQVAAGDTLAIIDPISIGNTQPFWDLIAEPGRTVIAHAAREESRFCYRFTGKPIGGLFDTQLAAGFVGMEYPASLGNLVNRLCNKTLPKGQTRTNWRHRPLSRDQIVYALHDVTELEEMHQKLAVMIDKLDRKSWVDEEAESKQQAVIEAENRENWRRVSGSSGLNARQLEIVKHVWRWRENRAKTTDRLTKRVMRDDLIVELAKVGSADAKKIRNIRGLDRRGFTDHYDDIAAAISDALAVPEDELPKKSRGTRRVVSPMLSQFLSTSIACISRQHKLAPPIVGNAEDVRELLGHELDRRKGDTEPSLLKGWRGEIVGKTFRRILAGELAIRVADVKETQPLEFIDIQS